MILLAVDTSGLKGSLAVAHFDQDYNVQTLNEVQWTGKAIHSEVATLQLQNILTKSQTQLRDLTHLVVNVGPGSFTGLRVGLSLVRTLAFSLDLPVASINSLENLAFSRGVAGEKVFVATKAVQNFFYVAAYECLEHGLSSLLLPQSAEEHELQHLAADCNKILIEGHTMGFDPQAEARELVQWISKVAQKQMFFAWKNVEPLYIRGSEAEEKLKRRLLRPI